VPTADAAPGGLTAAEAAARLAELGPNELPEPKRPSLLLRIARELLQPLVLLLLVASVVSATVLDEPADAAVIAAIVVLNAAIGLAQEGRASRALAALREMESPRARVVRDGRSRDVAAREIVPGDRLVVTAGERVPADAALVSAEGLEVDEAVLTGESLPVGKSADPDHGAGEHERLSAGTLVTRGRGVAVVTATGRSTEVGRIAHQLQGRSPTPLQVELAGVARLLGAAAVLVAGGVLVLLLFRLGDTVTSEEAFLTAVALAVAAVPEGLATVTAVALAIGVRHMADQGAIVRRLPAVETLGSTTVLVFDKTGTLTENRLRLTALQAPGVDVADLDTAPPSLRTDASLVAALCNDNDIGPPDHGDPVEQALLDAVGPDAAGRLRAEWPRVDAVPFSSEDGWMGTGHRHVDSAAALVTVKGGPEVVLDHCRSWLEPAAGTRPLDSDGRAGLLATTGRLASRGAKVLALALGRDGADVAAAWRAGHLVFVGLVALEDPLRSAGTESVAAVHRAGIRLVMATGDHPGTAVSIADEVDIDGSPARADVLTGDDIRTGGWPADPASVPVYGRIKPDQKLELVQRLRTRGEVVAMTGDGVNDAPALHAADIGVALGRSGTEVAREAADLVLTDDDLATMVEAVRRGRIIYDAIRRVVDYLVGGNLSEIALVVGVLLLRPDLGVPLLPIHLLWVNLLTDGAPAVALGIDPVDDGVLQRPPRPRTQRLLDRAHWRRLLARGATLASGPLLAATVVARQLDLGAAATRTLGLTVLVVAHLLYALVLGRFRWRGVVPLAVAGGLALHLAAVLLPAGRDLLGLHALPPTAWPLIVALGALPVLALHLLPRRWTGM